jgi:methionyl-tRNA synthetase
MVHRMNGDLANDLGNLAQRVLSMIAKNCGGTLPVPGAFTAADEALLGPAKGLHARIAAELDRQAFHLALDAAWQVVGAANRYVDEQAPWALRKSDPARMGTVLYVVAEVVRRIATLIQPFMPDSCGKLLDQLAVAPDRRSFAALEQALQGGTPLPAPSGVFPRFVEAPAA